MFRFKFDLLGILLLLSVLSACTTPEGAPRKDLSLLPPDELYGQLFIDIQSNDKVFPDSKTFVDCTPLYDSKTINTNYNKLEGKKDADALRAFITRHFKTPSSETQYQSDSSEINDHISRLWDALKRPADSASSGSLIPLPYPYVVPGGRFREVYYWDSYFTMLGLQEDGRIDLIRNILDNFSFLIDRTGHIPNGNRSYYLSRSQPPFFSLMIAVLAESENDSLYLDYLSSLEKEYTFWMEGAEKLTEKNPAHRRVVMLPDGSILNRYWDDKCTPRPESYREDIATAGESRKKNPDLKPAVIYRELRAAAESGWDFSSRWLEQEKNGSFNLSTIHTTHIIPVDLNCLLYNLEKCLAKVYNLRQDSLREQQYIIRAEERKLALLNYCWNEDAWFFMDYNFKAGLSTPVYSLAGIFPLFFNLASEEQAAQIAAIIEDSFLKSGGVLTSLYHTGEQWDAPNGWAPLQWMTIEGLRNYHHSRLADIIKNRWLHLNEQVYYSSYKMLEKYNVEDPEAEGGGGEYPNQDGFGWTNGVYQKLSAE